MYIHEAGIPTQVLIVSMTAIAFFSQSIIFNRDAASADIPRQTPLITFHSQGAVSYYFFSGAAGFAAGAAGLAAGFGAGSAAAFGLK